MRGRRAAALAAAAFLLVGCGSSAAPDAGRPPAASTTPAGTTTPATSSTIRLPPAAGVLDYQLGGPYPPAPDVRIVDRDRTATPALGRYNVCYVNAFQTQPDEAASWRRVHPGLLLHVHGALVQDPGWPGEFLFDTSTAAKRAALLRIVGGWIDGCARRGFDAVEADNLDSWTRHGVGSALSVADNVAFARLLVRRAHADGLAIGQKNAAEQAAYGRRSIGFDFAVAEECEVYHECGSYTAAYGRRVFEIEYTDNGRTAYARACTARHGRISIVLRDRDVVPRGSRGYYYRHC